MHTVTYYQRILLLPVILLLWYIPVGDRPNPFADWRNWGFGALAFGLPYLLTLARYHRTLRHGDAQEMQELLRRLPPRLWAAQLLVGAVTGFCMGGFGGIGAGLLFAAVAGIGSIVVGYAYVLAAGFVYGLLVWVNWIQPENEFS